MMYWKEGFSELAYQIDAQGYLLWNFLMPFIVVEAAAHLFVSKTLLPQWAYFPTSTPPAKSIY